MAWLKRIAFPVLLWHSSQVLSLFHGATKDDLADQLPDFQIIYPSVVSASGEFISHDLENAPSLTHQHYAKRRKRSLDEVGTVVMTLSNNDVMPKFNRKIDLRNDIYSSNHTSDDSTYYDRRFDVNFRKKSRISPIHNPGQYLHFNLSAFESNFHLRVQMKPRLIAPGAKSIRFTADGRRIEKDLALSCYYHGKITQDTSSKVAISTCNGLAGLIKTDGDEFFIEPLESQDSGTPQRHVIYRRPPRSALSETVNTTSRPCRALNPEHQTLQKSVDAMLNDLKGKHPREKRHSKPDLETYNMEVMLTADSDVVEFHGRPHVENYLVTLMNIVDEIYHDSSLGKHINIVLSRLYQLDSEQSEALIVKDNPAGSLKNVCKWAHTMQQTDLPPHGGAPDHSIFLTRRKFGPAGYAHVAGMCKLLRSCSLNLEDGFSSAFVVAHETGHVLGMEHDGEGNECSDDANMGSIMAPLVQAAFHRYHWSRCSQKELKTNLRIFDCLLNDPHAHDRGPTPSFPGITYSLDDQCRFDFGQGYRRCTAFRNMDVCRTLWCSHDENPLFCKTKKGPPVDGTSCGENMWCFKSHCVWRDNQHRPIPGNWSAWSPFSVCSRSCGTGVKFKSRECDNPAPMYGGNDCIGPNVDFVACNSHACPPGGDFRANQCQYKNNEVEFKQQRHKWLPYEPINPDLKCELYCVSKKTDDVVTMGEFVVDGTQCSYDDPHGICIRGECVEIGCDKVLGSNLREDVCGVCGGNGSECRNVTGKVKRRTGRRLDGYAKLYKIPKGARNVQIDEEPTGHNSNILALKSRSERRYVLNAKSKVIPEDRTPYQSIMVGALWTYESRSGLETLITKGPITSDVIVMVLIKERAVKISVRYRYVLRAGDVSKQSRDIFGYEIKKWSSCSVTCGTGYKRARYGCKNKSRNKWVSKRNCRGKPPRSSRRGVNTQPCSVECAPQARWSSGRWGPCSLTCGGEGVQHRNITCRHVTNSGQEEVAAERLCLFEEKPPQRRACRSPACPGRWRSGPWSKCSTTCGDGIHRRNVVCWARGMTSSSFEECSGEKPSVSKPCRNGPCQARSSTLAQSTTTTASTVVGKCDKDRSIFCTVKAIAQYCMLSSYQRICCLSCPKYLQSNLANGASQRALERPQDVAFLGGSELIDPNFEEEIQTSHKNYGMSYANKMGPSFPDHSRTPPLSSPKNAKTSGGSNEAIVYSSVMTLHKKNNQSEASFEIKNSANNYIQTEKFRTSRSTMHGSIVSKPIMRSFFRRKKRSGAKNQK